MAIKFQYAKPKKVLFDKLLVAIMFCLLLITTLGINFSITGHYTDVSISNDNAGEVAAYSYPNPIYAAPFFLIVFTLMVIYALNSEQTSPRIKKSLLALHIILIIILAFITGLLMLDYFSSNKPLDLSIQAIILATPLFFVSITLVLLAMRSYYETASISSKILKQIKTNKNLNLVSLIIFIIFVVSLFLGVFTLTSSKLTGMFGFAEVQNFTKDINQNFTSSEIITLDFLEDLAQNFSLSSFSIVGVYNVEPDGFVEVELISENKSYLVFSTKGTNSQEFVTGSFTNTDNVQLSDENNESSYNGKQNFEENLSENVETIKTAETIKETNISEANLSEKEELSESNISDLNISNSNISDLNTSNLETNLSNLSNSSGAENLENLSTPESGSQINESQNESELIEPIESKTKLETFCIETCVLPDLNASNLKLQIKIKNGWLYISEIRYSKKIAAQRQIEILNNITNETNKTNLTNESNKTNETILLLEVNITDAKGNLVPATVYFIEPQTEDVVAIGKNKEELNREELNNKSTFSVTGAFTEAQIVKKEISVKKEIDNKYEEEIKDKHKKEIKGKYKVKVLPQNMPIKQIIFNDLEIQSQNNIINFIRLDDTPENILRDNFVEVYAIDPRGLNFASATVTVIAKGNVLYKCKSWDFEARECKPVCGFDAEKQTEVCQSGWQKLMDIVPGQEYSFTLTPEDPSYAEYNATLGAPQCKNFESPCIANSSLLRCNDNQASPGPEPNQPNTIDTCTDSTTSGTCHSDESVENITITDLNSSYFRPGDTVNVTVWWYCYDTTDRIALYYTNSTSSINWVNKLAGTTTCPTTGYYTRNITFTLDNVPGEHAVRAIMLYANDIGSACPTGSYRDQDDVAFRVASKPVTTLNLPPDNYYNDSAPFVNVTFNCSATADVLLKNISLYITNSSNQSFSLNQTTAISGTSNSTAWTLTLGVGNYTWNCLTYDNASQFDWGDANRSLKINWTDNYPTVTLVSPPDGNITISKNVNFTCNATDDIQLSNITFYWNYSGSWQANGTVAVSGTSNQTTFSRTNLSNGVILWNCRACDNASQCSFATTNWTVTVNYTNTAPQYSNVGSNTTTPYTNEPVLHYAYWQDNDALSGYIFSSNYSGAWQNDSWQPLTGAANWSNVTKNAPPTSGVYGWRIYVNDSENVWNVTDIQIINVQNKPPQITLNLPNNGQQFENVQDINFNFTATDDLSSTLSCSIYLDNALNQTNNSIKNNTLTNFLISGISYGSHNWYINCSDNEFSNTSETRTFNIIDTIAPTITFIPLTDSGTVYRTYIQANVSASDSHSGLKNITIYLYDSNGNLLSSQSSTSSPFFANFTSLSEGNYYINATAYDNFNNSASTETRQITIYLNKPPQITLNLPNNGQQFENVQDINFNFTATDDLSSTLSCS
ncbi:MAG: hypothetical protein ACP5KK_02805, partial [Candidatus Nanoarchaeia archaeon]